MIEELRSSAIDYYVLHHIQAALNQLPAPLNNWYYDWIKGSVKSDAIEPFATSKDLDWDAAHHEGYAVFWNQNIAKFLMTRAAPVTAPGGVMTPNTQSELVRIQVANVVMGGAVIQMPGLALPQGGIVTPGGPTPYLIPAGTTQPGVAPLAGAVAVAPGTVIPVGTLIGPGGVLVAAPVLGVNPVIVPGGYTLTEALTLPPAGAVLAPQNALGLALVGRNTYRSTYSGDISGVVDDFNPAAPAFDWIHFTRGAGYPAVFTGARRPAFVTLDVNRAAPNNAPSDRLVPIIAYHAPAAATASSAGMQRASYIQPVYQAFDWAAGAWVNCSNAMLGGDFNVVVDTVGYAYNAFYNTFANGGAGMTPAIYAAAAGGPPPTRGENVANKSMVAISQFMGPPIYSANTADYRTRAIDNIFFRGLGVAAGAGSLADLPVAVGGGGGVAAIPAAVVNGFAAVPWIQAINNAMVAGMPVINGPLISGASTLFDINAGFMGAAPTGGNNTAARRGAEFVRLCVSDHLPSAIQATL